MTQLNAEAVARARYGRYLQRRNTRVRLPFAEMCDLLRRHGINTVARQAGVSKQRVYQLLAKIFMPLMPDRPNLRELRQELTRQQNAADLEDLKKAPGLLRMIGRWARAEGYDVQRIPVAFEERGQRIKALSRRSLLINGRACLVVACAYRFSLSRGNAVRHKFVIIVSTSGRHGRPGKTLIVSTKVLLKYLRKRGCTTFYLPRRESASRSLACRINFWQFDDWGILQT